MTLKPLPVMVPVSIDELEVMLRCPPLMTLSKSTEPASMVSAPVVVMAAFPMVLPEYQLPAADTAADDESARMPTSELLVPILPSVMVPLPDVRVTLEVPRRVPRVMLSLDVVIDRAPLGVTQELFDWYTNHLLLIHLFRLASC